MASIAGAAFSNDSRHIVEVIRGGQHELQMLAS
jgi:hypothetical protein